MNVMLNKMFVANESKRSVWVILKEYSGAPRTYWAIKLPSGRVAPIHFWGDEHKDGYIAPTHLPFERWSTITVNMFNAEFIN
jgi:hypothetical protein